MVINCIYLILLLILLSRDKLENLYDDNDDGDGDGDGGGGGNDGMISLELAILRKPAKEMQGVSLSKWWLQLKRKLKCIYTCFGKTCCSHPQGRWRVEVLPEGHWTFYQPTWREIQENRITVIHLNTLERLNIPFWFFKLSVIWPTNAS